MTGINSENVTKFLNHIKPMTCETAKRLLLPDTLLNTTPNSIETFLNKTHKSTDIHKQQSVNIFNMFDLNLSPDEVDVAHVGLAGALIILLLFSIICCCLCYCCKKGSDRVRNVSIICNLVVKWPSCQFWNLTPRSHTREQIASRWLTSRSTTGTGTPMPREN